MLVRPVQAGETLEIDVMGSIVPVLVDWVEQRNWSRVAHGRDETGGTYFLKQFIDRSARVNTSLMEAEQQSSALANELYSGVEVLTPVGRSDDACLLAYSFRHFVALDLLLADTAQGDLLPAARRWAHALLHPLPVSSGNEEASIPAFKGLDLSNVGLADSGELVLFDLGPPVSWPRTRVAARILVTAAYGRWKRSVATLLKGPPKRLIADLGQAMRPVLEESAVRAELARESEQRLATLSTGTWRRRLAVAAGGRIAGHLYARAASKYCLQQVHE